MLSQTDLDTALSEAQAAVNTLAENVSALQNPPSAPGQAPVATPRQRTVTPQPPPARPAGQPSADCLPAHLRRILNLKVPVIVRVAQRPILLNDVLKLVPGNILEFDRPVDSELDLLVNNHQIGTGVAVKINERFGLRINRVGEARDRLRQITQQ